MTQKRDKNERNIKRTKKATDKKTDKIKLKHNSKTMKKRVHRVPSGNLERNNPQNVWCEAFVEASQATVAISVRKAIHDVPTREQGEREGLRSKKNSNINKNKDKDNSKNRKTRALLQKALESYLNSSAAATVILVLMISRG
jgi:hypothetical protein